MIEIITHKKKQLAKIIRSSYINKKGINFFTDNKLSQQVAYMHHPKNHIIQPHLHYNKKKIINDTTEVLIILEGIIRVDFYNFKKKFLLSKFLQKKDIIILLSGGHGFKIIKKAKFIEVKQGPYIEKNDKVKF